MSLRQSFTDALGKDVADLLWTANTLMVYPATPQQFSLGSLLPAVMYMFRRGFRRGKGRFATEFAPAGEQIRPNIWCVAGRLSQGSRFEGFESETSKDILGDLLLCDALENKGGQEGHFSEVQRAFPVHYYASWLDLPAFVGNLRFVPEMLVALLANQCGRFVEASSAEEFSVGKAPSKNPLLRIFDRGVEYGENAAVLAGNDADKVNELAQFSVEEWLMVQLGRTCGQAPEKLTRTMGADSSISANQPLARRATAIFREDLSGLLRYYGLEIPRRGLTPMLECIIGIGLWQSFLSSLNAIVHWERNCELPDLNHCKPFELFADASGGLEPRLRDLAEASGFELQAFINSATTSLAVLRVMDAAARNNRRLKDQTPVATGSSKWIELLGQLRHGTHSVSDSLLDGLSEKCSLLHSGINRQMEESEICNILGSPEADKDPARVLAEALVSAMGSKLLQGHYLKFLDSAGMSSEPHGMVKKRRITRRLESGKTQRMDARSVVLSNTLLDALVHTLLPKCDGRMSFSEFLGFLKSDYGILVDEAPAGVPAEREDLHRNRSILEKRLRDLGLLTGVNDAESMKRLRARYRTSQPFRSHD